MVTCLTRAIRFHIEVGARDEQADGRDRVVSQATRDCGMSETSKVTRS